MRINFELFDLKVDKIRNPIAYYVELLPTKILYHLEAEIDKEPDIENESYESEEGVYLCETRVYKREALIGCSISFTKPFDDELHIVMIEVMGASDNIEVTFKSKKAALKFHSQIIKYILNEDTSIHNNSK